MYRYFRRNINPSKIKWRFRFLNWMVQPTRLKMTLVSIKNELKKEIDMIFFRNKMQCDVYMKYIITKNLADCM